MPRIRLLTPGAVLGRGGEKEPGDCTEAPFARCRAALSLAVGDGAAASPGGAAADAVAESAAVAMDAEDVAAMDAVICCLK